MVGGYSGHVMARNMLKKMLTNTLAEQFSWAGKKTKRTFKDLGLAKLIMRKYSLYNFVC